MSAPQANVTDNPSRLVRVVFAIWSG